MDRPRSNGARWCHSILVVGWLSTLLLLTGCTPTTRQSQQQSVETTGNTALNPPSKFIRKQIASLDRQIIAREFKSLELMLRTLDIESSGTAPAWATVEKELQRTDRNLHSRFVNGEYIYLENNRNIWAYHKDAPSIGGPVLTPNGVQVMTADELRQLMR